MPRVPKQCLWGWMQDVGQSILESYSRVLESLAFNIIARIDDVLYADDMVKKAVSLPPPAPPSSDQAVHRTRRTNTPYKVHLTAVPTPYTTPYVSPNPSPTQSPNQLPNSPHDSAEGNAVIRGPNLHQVLSDFIARDKLDPDPKKETDSLLKASLEESKPWSYAVNLESRNALHSPPSRD